MNPFLQKKGVSSPKNEPFLLEKKVLQPKEIYMMDSLVKEISVLLFPRIFFLRKASKKVANFANYF